MARRISHLTALLVKLITVALIIGLFSPVLFRIPHRDQALLTVSYALISYILGDLYLREEYDQETAVMGETLVAFLLLYGYGILVAPSPPLLLAVVGVSLVMGLVEGFFHDYLENPQVR